MTSSKFKIGDRVLVLDDDVAGVISFAKAEFITITTDDGIDLVFHKSELISEASMKIDKVIVKDEPSLRKNKKRNTSRKKAKEIPAVEIDLHIHQLVKNERGMDAYDKLNKQLDTAKYQLERAIKNRVPKLIFIHGIGAGVLRAELEYLLNRYDGISYYDADYQKYGRGATEVYIYQNPS